MLKYALLALLILPIIGITEAKTVTFKEAYQDINLYGGESLTVINNDNFPHSITSYNQTYHSFDSGLIQPNGQTNFGFATDGDYAFYDSRNPSLNGTIHVRTTETPQAEITMSENNVKAGDTVNIYGNYYTANKDVVIDITNPDGTNLQTLTVKATGDGKLYIPVSTTRFSQNGVYTVTDVHTSQQTAFIVSGGVTPENPTVEAPPSDSGSSGGSSGSGISTINNTATNSTITPNKQAMIDYVKMQISILQEILKFLEAQ